MAAHGSAIVREATPLLNHPTRTKTILNALTRRAQAVLNDRSIDAESRAIIRYGLEVNDPWLADLGRRAESGENIFKLIRLLKNKRSQRNRLPRSIVSCGRNKQRKTESLGGLAQALGDSFASH